MARYSYTAHVAAAPAQIFAVLADAARTPQWLGVITNVSDISHQPLQLASTATYHYALSGQRGLLPGTVTSYEAEQHLQLELHNAQLEVTITVDITAAPASGSGCEVALTIAASGKGLAGMLAEPVIAAQLPEHTTAALRNLRTIAS